MDIVGTSNMLAVGDRIQCKDYRDLRRWALRLSADGYGIGILGYHDIYDNILTITALPEGSEDVER